MWEWPRELKLGYGLGVLKGKIELSARVQRLAANLDAFNRLERWRLKLPWSKGQTHHASRNMSGSVSHIGNRIAHTIFVYKNATHSDSRAMSREKLFSGKPNTFLKLETLPDPDDHKAHSDRHQAKCEGREAACV